MSGFTSNQARGGLFNQPGGNTMVSGPTFTQASDGDFTVTGDLIVEGAFLVSAITGDTVGDVTSTGTSTFNLINAASIDTTSIEVTNIKAKDGTLSAVITDGTGVFNITSAALTTADIAGGTMNNVAIGATTPASASFTTLNVVNDIIVSGLVDGRDIATDGTKLDGIEALADVTDATNVEAAGALMDSELANEAAVKALDQGLATTDSPTFVTVNATDLNVTTLDVTDIEVTNIDAKDGTNAATIADATGVMTINSAVLTTAAVNGGTIDSVVIGGTTPAAGAFTDITATGGTITGIADLAVEDGGTGASTAEEARLNLDAEQAGTALALAIALG